MNAAPVPARPLPAWILLASACALSAGEFKLPSIVSDHMVLQSEMAVPVWGWADAGEQISVEFAGQRKTATANADRRWMVKLDPLEASRESRTMMIHSVSRGLTMTIADVIVGEVWAGGGQSNMEFDMKALTRAGAEIEGSANALLRQFCVLKNPSAQVPAEDVQGWWTAARPGTTEDFIAAGYYFAKSIQRELNKPVGLIKVCWGGSRVEPWISPDGLASTPALESGARNMHSLSEKNKAAFRAWLEQTHRQDRGDADISRFLEEDPSAAAGWVSVPDRGPASHPSLPEYGAVWFRKEITLPVRQTGALQVLQLGPSARFDRVYWNGILIGERTPDNFTGLTSVRHYLIPPSVLREGVNQLAVRIYAPAEPPGFSWNPTIGATRAAGGWMAKAEFALPSLDPEQRDKIPPLTGQHVLPGRLFNGMIHPILPYAMRGALWYQGESNTLNPSLYRTSFPLLIRDWRRHWNQGEFPFYFCQLANYLAKTDRPGESAWAELREAQASALSLPNTGMAVLIDTGESEDIHPQSKETAGERLAKIALAKTYLRPIAYSGPRYKSMTVESGAIRIRFDHIEGGLVSKPVPATYDVVRRSNKSATLSRNRPGSELEGFAICGPDRKWTWADARIEDDTVRVWSPDVPTPAAVRYAWSDNPTCNLYNSADLPALPFRTDDFPTGSESAPTAATPGPLLRASATEPSPATAGNSADAASERKVTPAGRAPRFVPPLIEKSTLP